MQERVKPASKPKPRAKPQKKKVILEIDAKLAAAANAKGIDLATALEQALRRELTEASATPLGKDDREAIEWADRLVAEHGRWTDGLDKL